MVRPHHGSRSVAVLAIGLLAGCGAIAPDGDDDSAQISAAENEQEEVLTTRLRAEIHGPTTIRFTLEGAEGPDSVSAYRLTNGEGREVPIAEVRRAGDSGFHVTPAEPLDPMRVHYLEIPDLELRALARRDPIFRTIESDKPLGALVSAGGSETTFRIFSPRAESVRLYLYGGKDDPSASALDVIEMEVDADGVWEASVEADLRGRWYDFTVHGPADPGNWFWETHPVHISDPYALVNDDSHGKSRVWRDGPPPPPVEGGRPAMEDVVAYEVHVQDFTDLLPVADVETGTLPAMATPGLTNAHGEPIGFDYLVDLGVNVVHLMPVQEYLHYPDAEWQDALSDDSFAREMGIDRENYQWGSVRPTRSPWRAGSDRVTPIPGPSEISSRRWCARSTSVESPSSSMWFPTTPARTWTTGTCCSTSTCSTCPTTTARTRTWSISEPSATRPSPRNGPWCSAGSWTSSATGWTNSEWTVSGSTSPGRSTNRPSCGSNARCRRT